MIKMGRLGQFTLCLKYSSKLLNAESVSFTNTTLFPASGLEAMGNFCPSSRTAIAGQLMGAGRPTLADCGRAAARQVGRQEQTRAGQVGKGCRPPGFALLYSSQTFTYKAMLLGRLLRSILRPYTSHIYMIATSKLNTLSTLRCTIGVKGTSHFQWATSMCCIQQGCTDKGAGRGWRVRAALARAARAASSPPSTAFHRTTHHRQLQILHGQPFKGSSSSARDQRSLLHPWDVTWCNIVFGSGLTFLAHTSLALVCHKRTAIEYLCGHPIVVLASSWSILPNSWSFFQSSVKNSTLNSSL